MKVKLDMCQNFYVRNHFKFPKRVRLESRHRRTGARRQERPTKPTRLDARCRSAWSDMHATGVPLHAYVGVHARTRGRIVCAPRDAPRAWPSSVHQGIPTRRGRAVRRYACCYETEIENCMTSTRSIFDIINTILKIFLLPIVALPSSRIITEIIFVWLHYRNPISVNYAGFNLWNEICASCDVY